MQREGGEIKREGERFERRKVEANENKVSSGSPGCEKKKT